MQDLDLLVSCIRAGAPPGGAPAVVPDPIHVARWQALLPLARKHGMSGLLHQAVQTLNPPDVPADARNALYEIFLNTHLAQRLAYEELGNLLDAFARAELPVVVLKGPALARNLYPEAALRPFGDLDLLIHPADNARAGQILIERGCRVPVEMRAGTDNRLWAQQTYSRAGNHPIRVELHWHLFVLPYYRRRAQLDWFWNHLSGLKIYGRDAFAFDPTAQLVHLSGHYALHHSEPRLIWLYDLALVLVQWRDQLDWHEIGRVAHSFGLVRALQLALQDAADIWNIPLPSEAIALLNSNNSSRYERFMFSLARSRKRPARWIADGMALDGGHYWLAHLVPSREYMQRHYKIRHAALLPFWYAVRLVSGGYKSVRALLR